MTSNDNVLTIEIFNSGIAEIKSDIQGLNNEIQVLKNDVQELKNEIRVLDKNVAVNSARIEMLQSSINWGVAVIAIVVVLVHVLSAK